MDTPIKLYLDATTLIDFCWEDEPRHPEAEQLIDICGQYVPDIEVYTSEWSWTETHGRIYSKILARDLGITWENEYKGHKEKGKDPRTYFPPHYDKLSEVMGILDDKEAELVSRCRFITVPSSELSYAFYLTRQLAHSTAIYPQDSLHLAIAIEQLVHFFVATDGDLLDRIIWQNHNNFIHQLRSEMSDPFEPPPFEAVPLKKIRWTQRITPPAESILTRLGELGFS